MIASSGSSPTQPRKSYEVTIKPGRNRMLGRTLAAVLAAAALACPANAQDAYVMGATAALTGPPAGTNAPPIEGLRLYVDRLNAAGGINGKKIQLTVLDDQGEPSKAAANPKPPLTQDNVSLL